MIAARILAVSLLVLGIQAAQAATTTLTSFGDGSVRFISDGTSNTIQLGETSSAVACFKNVSQPASITDGTSNTLLLSEILGASFTAGHIYGYNNILPFFGDGSVRTVFPGGALDSYSYCLTEVDLLDPVGGHGQLSSNTIRIGEDGFFSICFQQCTAQSGDRQHQQHDPGRRERSQRLLPECRHRPRCHWRVRARYRPAGGPGAGSPGPGGCRASAPGAPRRRLTARGQPPIEAPLCQPGRSGA